MNRLIHFFAAVILIIAVGTSARAQGGYTVNGTVTDDLGPVIGATIMEQGTSNGTTTGPDGGFSLTVSGPSSPVTISCIGYESLTFEAASVPSTITMKEDSEYLDEAVVIGYGTVKKDDMTGSIAAVKADDINRGAVTSTQDMIKGRIAGVLVTPGDGGPGSGSRIRIRGAASLNASNDPLIIIDGVPIANGAGGGMTNPLDLLNPNDIESFSVLKDASAAAIYGSRASNGVIIITTKKGSGNRPQVTYSGSVSVMNNSKAVPVMSPYELNNYYYETYPAGTEIGDRIIALTGNQHTDWQSLIFRTAFATEHNVSMYGTYDGMMPYRASVGYLGQQGTLQESSYERITADITLNCAEVLMKEVEAEAVRMGMKVVTAVADSHGNPVAVRCMDGAFIGSYDVALNKTYTAIAFQMSTEELGKLSRPDGPLYGIQHTNEGKIVIFGGGEPLEVDEKIIGALGVSGGTAEQDTMLAAYGKEVFKEAIRVS